MSTSNSVFWSSLAVLKLAEEVFPGSELNEELLWLFEATGDLNAELYAASKPVDSKVIDVRWPDLQADVAKLSQADRAKTSPKHVLAAMLHYQAYKLLPGEKQAELRAAAVQKYGVTKPDGAKPSAPDKLGTKAASPSPSGMKEGASQTEEPLYDGKPLSYWLDTIGRERSAKGYQDALSALAAMLTRENAAEISARLLSVLRQQRPPDSGLERNAFKLLRSAHPGPAFYALLANEIEKGTPAWQARLLAALKYFQDDATTIAPLTQWMENNVFEGRMVGVQSECADYYLSLIHRKTAPTLTEEQKEHFAQVLIRCKGLTEIYWLSNPLPRVYVAGDPKFGADTFALETWYAPLADHVEQVAIRVVQYNDQPRPLVAQAIAILRILHARNYDRAGMQDHRAEIVETLRKVMKSWRSDPTKLYESQQVNSNFGRLLLSLRELAVFSPALDATRPYELRTYPKSDFALNCDCGPV